jgi:hypothetical protein
LTRSPAPAPPAPPRSPKDPSIGVDIDPRYARITADRLDQVAAAVR